jgi:hypothetical protein
MSIRGISPSRLAVSDIRQAAETLKHQALGVKAWSRYRTRLSGKRTSCSMNLLDRALTGKQSVEHGSSIDSANP